MCYRGRRSYRDALTPIPGQFWSIPAVFVGLDAVQLVSLVASEPETRHDRRLSCASATSCLATLFHGDDGAVWAVLRSADGGVTWSTSGQLPGQLATGLACPSPQVCTEGGDEITRNALKGGVIGASFDGGTSIVRANLPANTLAVLSLSCPDTSKCFALAINWSGVVDSPGTFELFASN